MKTIHLEITDNLYAQFKELLSSLPIDGFQIIEEDSDILTMEESKEVYRLKKQTDKNDFSEFENWDTIKSDI